MKNQVPDLQTEFQKVIPPQMQPLCRHWPAFLRQADPKDDRIRSAFFDMLLAPRHWGIVGVVDDASRGLLELERLAGVPTQLGGYKVLTFKLLFKETFRAEKSSTHALYCLVIQLKHEIKESSLSILSKSH